MEIREERRKQRMVGSVRGADSVCVCVGGGEGGSNKKNELSQHSE